MKTPEQANYPTPKKTLEKNLKLISDHIDNGKFSFDFLYHPSNISQLNDELKLFGWKISEYSRYNETSYTLTPL